MNIIENIMAAPMDLLGKSKQDAYDDGMELLRTVGLADKAFNYPDCTDYSVLCGDKFFQS